MMQERLQYKNHMGEIIDFGREGIYVKSNALHDYNWTVIEKNGRISSFKRDITRRSFPVVIFCSSPEEGVAARNRLTEVAEKDILAKRAGMLIIGKYYFKCFITDSKKSRYLASRRMMEAELTVTTDKPYWVRETLHTFRKAGIFDSGLTYPHDFPFDYASGLKRSILANADFTASNFRMIIYGPCTVPTVNVSGHAYVIRSEAAEGEYFTIDSVAKTVTKTAKDGTVTNMYNSRGRESYIFEKIGAGNNTVSRDGDFGVDIILLEERSEPRWT